MDSRGTFGKILEERVVSLKLVTKALLPSAGARHVKGVAHMGAFIIRSYTLRGDPPPLTNSHLA